MHYTDLHIEMDSVLLQGSVEGQRGFLIKVIYQNRAGRDIRITLPGRDDVPFLQGDTILLGVSRKYMRNQLESLLTESGVHILHSSHSDFSGGGHNAPGFGMALLVLEAGSQTARPKQNIAHNLWGR
jgi:hypothetical protein